MAQQTISVLKNWFLTGLKPLQQQFHDWLDSYWHKSESIPQSSVTGLPAALSSLATTAYVNSVMPAPEVVVLLSSQAYVIAAGKMLEVVAIISETAQTCFVESSAMAADLAEVDLIANQATTVRLDMYAVAPGSVYFRFSNPITVIFYKR